MFRTTTAVAAMVAFLTTLAPVSAHNVNPEALLEARRILQTAPHDRNIFARDLGAALSGPVRVSLSRREVELATRPFELIAMPPQNVTEWDMATNEACIRALQRLERSTNPSGACVCYNLPAIDTTSGVFQADLRLYKVSEAREQFAGIPPENIQVSLAYTGAGVTEARDGSIMTQPSGLTGPVPVGPGGVIAGAGGGVAPIVPPFNGFQRQGAPPAQALPAMDPAFAGVQSPAASVPPTVPLADAAQAVVPPAGAIPANNAAPAVPVAAAPVAAPPAAVAPVNVAAPSPVTGGVPLSKRQMMITGGAEAMLMDEPPRSDPRPLRTYTFVGQIDPQQLEVNNPMTLDILERLVMPVVTLTGVRGTTQVSTNITLNEASFVTGVFSDQVILSTQAMAAIEVDKIIAALRNGTVAFQVPGVRIMIFPVGLIIQSLWTVAFLAVWGYGTLRRLHHQDQFQMRSALSKKKVLNTF